MRLLAYGDSLTWGFRPEDGARHPPTHRWGPVAAATLGWELAEDGLNGRTTVRDEWSGPADRNGARLLPAALHAQSPLTHVAILLGTNDLLLFPGMTAEGAAWGLRRLLQIVATHPYPGGASVPEVLVIAPPRLGGGPNPALDARAVEQSRRLPALYAELASAEGAAFLDAGRHAAASSVDGVHLAAEDTRAIGVAVAEVLRDAPAPSGA